MVSEAVVRRVIGVEGAEAFIKVTEGGWQDYLDEGISRYHRTTRANVVWDNMAKRCAILERMEGVRRIEPQGRPLFVLRERLLVRPKMYSETTTRNYPTAAQIAAQKSGLFPDYEYSVVTFGYQLDRAEAGIESYFVTSAGDDWVINLEELANGELNPVTQLLPGMDEDLSAIEPIRFTQNG